MTIKVLWLPGPLEYRLRVFAGANTQLRKFAGELVLTVDEASALHTLLERGQATLEAQLLAEVGWVDPPPASA